MARPRVAVVGGGLAGLAAALALAKTGRVDVTLHEAADRLGGMAGASRVGSTFEDHGYHIFPPWYENLYAIIDELGIRGNLKDITGFHQLGRGDYPHFRRLTNFTSLRFAWKNLWSGSIPFWDLLLYYYSVGDLLCQPYRYRAFLDQVSVNGFIRSRFYRTEAVARQYQDLLLKFVSVPSYTVSAMTTQRMLSYWVAQGVPMHRILSGDMHTTFIAPWEARLRELSCAVETGSRLTKLVVANRRITGLEFVVGGDRRAPEADFVILALPPRILASLVDDAVYAADHDLANVKYLNHEAMAGLSLYLDRRIPELPAEHINLLGSRFALTAIDVSRHWAGMDTTVLNVIASDINALEGLSPEYAERAILDELKTYFPFLSQAGIVRSHFQPHYAEPLVMNDVGAWHFRPSASTRLENLFLAGAHCRSHIDMTSMEGATTTGLLAANAVLERSGLGPSWAIRRPPTASVLLMFLIRAAAFPLAVVAKSWITIRDRLRSP